MASSAPAREVPPAEVAASGLHRLEKHLSRQQGMQMIREAAKFVWRDAETL